MIIEDLMLDLMYNLPSMKKVKECVVTRDVVLDREKPITLIEKVGLARTRRVPALRHARGASSCPSHGPERDHVRA